MNPQVAALMAAGRVNGLAVCLIALAFLSGVIASMVIQVLSERRLARQERALRASLYLNNGDRRHG